MAKADRAQDPPALHPVAQVPVAFGQNTLDDCSPGWWSESTDGRCSETAALFAESQPAPLAIV